MVLKGCEVVGALDITSDEVAHLGLFEWPLFSGEHVRVGDEIVDHRLGVRPFDRRRLRDSLRLCQELASHAAFRSIVGRRSAPSDEVLNSDAAEYGGSGVGNMGEVHAGESGRASMVLPPLGVLWLQHDPQAHLPQQKRTGRLLLP